MYGGTDGGEGNAGPRRGNEPDAGRPAKVASLGASECTTTIGPPPPEQKANGSGHPGGEMPGPSKGQTRPTLKYHRTCLPV